MNSPYIVQVHQKEPSINSSYSYSSGGSSYSSSSGSSTPRDYSPATHKTRVTSSGRNLVINHHRTDFEDDAPNPNYRGSYSRTS